MISVRSVAPSRRVLGSWGGSIATGAVIGGSVGIAMRLGLVPGLWGGAGELASALNRLVGPVWVPMFLIGLRVGWLSLRALRTRFGHGALGAPVRPELGQLAPLFAALGLCGTVWGLSRAFDALGAGEFLTRIPELLGGLGAAMTSTLVGLGLQITTLMLAAFNPSFSRVDVRRDGAGVRFHLDGRALGADLDELARALAARQPEALLLAVDRGVPREKRAEIHTCLWQRTDSAIPVREVDA